MSAAFVELKFALLESINRCVSNAAYPGQIATVVNDRIRRNTMIYLCPYYDRIFPCRIRRNTVVYGEEDDRIRSLYTEFACDVRFTSYFSVYDRFSSYTVTTLYDRNTGTGITTKYSRIRSVIESYAVVNGRIRTP